MKQTRCVLFCRGASRLACLDTFHRVGRQTMHGRNPHHSLTPPSWVRGISMALTIAYTACTCCARRLKPMGERCECSAWVAGTSMAPHRRGERSRRSWVRPLGVPDPSEAQVEGGDDRGIGRTSDRTRGVGPRGDPNEFEARATGGRSTHRFPIRSPNRPDLGASLAQGGTSYGSPDRAGSMFPQPRVRGV